VGGHRFHNNEEVETAIREWLPQEAYNSYRDRISKIVPEWDNVLGVYVEKYCYFSGLKESACDVVVNSLSIFMTYTR
jgi:hypothetical protein